MSKYRFFQDAWVGTNNYTAGDIASTADVGGTLPTNWVPCVAVDPLDASAINAFWQAGVQLPGLVRQQWNGIPVAPPLIYWKPFNLINAVSYQLTGAGAALGPKDMANRGALP